MKLFKMMLLTVAMTGSLAAAQVDGGVVVDEADQQEAIDHLAEQLDDEVAAALQNYLTLPVLIKCLLDNDGEVIVVETVEVLEKDDLVKLLALLHQQEYGSGWSATRGFYLMVNGTVMTLQGFVHAVVAGFQTAKPHVINGSRWIGNYCKQKYQEKFGAQQAAQAGLDALEEVDVADGGEEAADQ